MSNSYVDVKFRTKNGVLVQLRACYRETNPNPLKPFLGTVVAFHGAPGTHGDFKLIVPRLAQEGIRVLAIDYPGFGYTPGYPDQEHCNLERQAFSNAFLSAVGAAGKTVFLGHSRGAENALVSAVEHQALGVAMVNPTGFREHLGIRPVARLKAGIALYKSLPRAEADALIDHVMKERNLKAISPEAAFNSMCAASECSLGGQIPYVRQLNDLPTKVFFAYSGKDELVEAEIVAEACNEYRHLTRLNLSKGDDASRLDQAVAESFKDGSKGAIVLFEEDGHFLTLSKPECIASAIVAMFRNDKDQLNKL